jgi:hypothetical protein
MNGIKNMKQLVFAMTLIYCHSTLPALLSVIDTVFFEICLINKHREGVHNVTVWSIPAAFIFLLYSHSTLLDSPGVSPH